MTHSLVAFYEESAPDYSGRYLSDILNADDSYLEKNHTFIQWLFPNKMTSIINPNAPYLTEEIINEFKTRQDLRDNVKRSFHRIMTFYYFDGNDIKYPWWATKNNHNYLRCTRILHTLKAFEMTKELDYFYSKLMFVYHNNEEVISGITYSYWKDAYEGQQTYYIRVNVKAVVEGSRLIDVRASSLEEANSIATEKMLINLKFESPNYEIDINYQEVKDISTEQE